MSAASAVDEARGARQPEPDAAPSALVGAAATDFLQAGVQVRARALWLCRVCAMLRKPCAATSSARRSIRSPHGHLPWLLLTPLLDACVR